MPGRKQQSKRDKVAEETNRAARIHSTTTVLMHAAISERVGLLPGDHKTVELLGRRGPMTPGQLGELTGLASSSVTALVDRLEKKGLVHRVRDPHDRRSVLVEVVPEGIAQVTDAFGPFLRRMKKFWSRYSVEELEQIRDYLVGSEEVAREATAEIASRKR